MKDAHDARYISRKHEKNIIFIPIEGVVATELEVNNDKKEDLIEHGWNCAMSFFKRWGY